jgi:putative FmdB family regulatory protein
MKYQYKCDECKGSFEKNLPIDDRDIPIKDSCPLCGKVDSVYRDFGSVSLTYDTVDVHTRAKKVGGEAYTRVMERIHKGAGKYSAIKI